MNHQILVELELLAPDVCKPTKHTLCRYLEQVRGTTWFCALFDRYVPNDGRGRYERCEECIDAEVDK